VSRSALEVEDSGWDTEETIRRIGAVVRETRKQRGMTLNALAEQTGVSVSMLSMLERGVASPSIGTLVSVTSALGLHMANLFASPESPADPVSRVKDQIEFETAEGVIRRIVHNDNLRGVEFVVNEYQPGTSSAGEALHHAGTEFGVVLSGTLTVTLDGIDHVLRAGDGITYSSQVPHRISNHGKTQARAVWINLDS
jgi:transcriptional regulator with XRE-family HTH domain